MLSNFFNFYNGKEYIEYTFTPGNTLYNLHYKGNRRNVSLILLANDEEHVIKIFKEAVELMVKCSEEYYCISPRHMEDWIYQNYVKKSLNILEDIKHIDNNLHYFSGFSSSITLINFIVKLLNLQKA